MVVLCGWLTCVAFGVTLAWYCPLIIRGKVKPILATWLIGAVTLDLSAGAYLATRGRVLDNIALFAGAIEISAIFATLVARLWLKGELKVALDPLQRKILAVTAVTILVWAVSIMFGVGLYGAEATFWTMQFLMLIAYVPSVAKALKLRKAFDSVGNWACIFIACIVGFVPAIASGNPRALFNSWRGLFSAGILLAILVFFDKKRGWRGWKREVVSHRIFIRRIDRWFLRRWPLGV